MTTHKDNYCQTGRSLYDSTEERFFLDSDDEEFRLFQADKEVDVTSDTSSLNYDIDETSENCSNRVNKMGFFDAMPQVSPLRNNYFYLILLILCSFTDICCFNSKSVANASWN